MNFPDFENFDFSPPFFSDTAIVMGVSVLLLILYFVFFNFTQFFLLFSGVSFIYAITTFPINIYLRKRAYQKILSNQHLKILLISLNDENYSINSKNEIKNYLNKCHSSWKLLC